jgi:hypothetical protein
MWAQALLAAVEAVIQMLGQSGQHNPAQLQHAQQKLDEAKQHMAAAGGQAAQHQPAFQQEPVQQRAPQQPHQADPQQQPKS